MQLSAIRFLSRERWHYRRRDDGDGSCTHNFADGPGYKFTSVAIELKPEHGTLTEEGALFRYVYRPDGGFKGKDAHLIKICATKSAAKGCSSIVYLATLE